MGTVQNHTLLGQTVDVGRIENGAGIIYLEVERRLIVYYYKKEVGSFFS